MKTKKARKNRRRKPLAPPLSFLDRSIYSIAMFLSFILPLGGVILLMFCADAKYSAESGVIAYILGKGFFWFVPLLFFVVISGVIWAESGLVDRKPLFGKRDVCYGPPKWAPVYPVFSKKYRNAWRRPVKPSEVTLKRMGRNAWLIFLATTILLSTLGFGCRGTITEGDVFHHVGSYGRETTYTPEDIDSLSIGIRKSGRHSWNYHIYMGFTMKDGRSMRFPIGSFREETRRDNLETMLRLKNYVDSEKISYYGQRRLDWYVSNQQFTEEEKELFSQIYPDFSH